MAFAATRDPEFSRYEGAVTARQGSGARHSLDTRPDADVNNNPDNPIINIRSYSENPEEVPHTCERSSKGHTPQAPCW